MKTKYNSNLLLVLSIFTLINVFFQTFWKQTPDVYTVLNYLDFFISCFFLEVWCAEFTKEKAKKWTYWVDFVLCFPIHPVLWAEYYMVLRFLRTVRSTIYIYHYFDKDGKTNKFFDVCVFCVFFVFISSLLVFNCEKHCETANIKNMSDSLWWAMATITTIGYGDRFPVTDLGRITAMLVMVGGVGLYASFTGFIVSKFNSSNDAEIAELKKQNQLILELLQKKKDDA